LIYQDESGIQQDLVRESGRIGKNILGKSQKLYGEKTGTKHKKTGLISGYKKLPGWC